LSHTDRQYSSKLPKELLVLCKAQIELRHFGGAVGIKLVDEIIRMPPEERGEALTLLIDQVKSNEINLKSEED